MLCTLEIKAAERLECTLLLGWVYLNYGQRMDGDYTIKTVTRFY